MKKLAFILLLAIVAMSSCKKDKDDDSQPTPIVNLEAKMACKIDGKDWSALTRITTLTNGNFVINGTSLTGDVINVTILGTNVKEYNLGTGVIEFSATYAPVLNNVDSVYTALNGKASLTEVDMTNKKISGTFRFNANNLKMNELQVTDGIFTKLAFTEKNVN